MRNILVLTILLLSNNISAQCLDSLKGMFIVEEMPSCLECKLELEAKLKHDVSQFNLDGIDTIYVCYEITRAGNIQNVVVKGLNNAQFTETIYKTLSTVKFSPALIADKPIDCPVFLMFVLEHINGNTNVKSIINCIRNKTEVEYNTERLNKNYREYFKENSTEKIHYMNISLIQGYIIQNISKKRINYMSVFSKKRNTKRLVIETAGDEIKGQLLIPAIRYEKYSESLNSTKLDFGDVPTDCEVILAITKKTNNSIEVYLEKFIFKGKSSLPIQFSEYSFSQLNQRINELQIK